MRGLPCASPALCAAWAKRPAACVGTAGTAIGVMPRVGWITGTVRMAATGWICPGGRMGVLTISGLTALVCMPGGPDTGPIGSGAASEDVCSGAVAAGIGADSAAGEVALCCAASSSSFSVSVLLWAKYSSMTPSKTALLGVKPPASICIKKSLAAWSSLACTHANIINSNVSAVTSMPKSASIPWRRRATCAAALLPTLSFVAPRRTI
mmetsp:Transcript_73605/g.139965  ORF Transcript_73605/g.139965 Transcript_73605/m.139965 type:complete len:209 (+) Transcript_73605:858-1484(+)